MSFTAILRKSASSVAPLASRIIRVGQRDNHPALFSALEHQVNLPCKNPSLVVPFLQRFCSTVTETQSPSSNESLLRALESEIKVAQETVGHDGVRHSFFFFLWVLFTFVFLSLNICNFCFHFIIREVILRAEVQKKIYIHYFSLSNCVIIILLRIAAFECYY